jgi:manganese/iron transport system permease protein
MLTLLTDPFQLAFMRQAIEAGILVGILCPVVGSYLIVQRMALLGDVIAHAVLPGLAIASFLKIQLSIGAFISGLLTAFILTWIRTQSRVNVDAAMALIFSNFFALGILLLTLLKNKLDLDAFLFGDILAVTQLDVLKTAGVTAIVLGLVRFFYKELLFYTFDRLGAEAIGLPVGRIYIGLMALVTLVIIASMQIVGVVLVIGLLVGPATTAYLLVKELHQMMILGAGFGVVSAIVGMYLSYYNNVPSGPCIVLVSGGLFVLALLLSPSQGILTRRS